MRIVIIDDEILIAMSLSSCLTRAGHKVLGTAGTLARGLQLIDANEMDIAIVDADFNGVSAEPLFTKLAERNVPALLITGYSDKQRPNWSPDRCLVKPLVESELLAAVTELGKDARSASGTLDRRASEGSDEAWLERYWRWMSRLVASGKVGATNNTVPDPLNCFAKDPAGNSKSNCLSSSLGTGEIRSNVHSAGRGLAFGWPHFL